MNKITAGHRVPRHAGHDPRRLALASAYGGDADAPTLEATPAAGGTAGDREGG